MDGLYIHMRATVDRIDFFFWSIRRIESKRYYFARHIGVRVGGSSH
jgi:hypothetical protein